jgi:hypothetical protein
MIKHIIQSGGALIKFGPFKQSLARFTTPRTNVLSPLRSISPLLPPLPPSPAIPPATLSLTARQIPRQTQSAFDLSKELTNLAKTYKDKNKYTGQDNNFDFKLVIFHDLCGRVGVTKEAKAKAYPIMLQGLARDHYYTNLRRVAQTLPFDQLCNATRNYFEGPEYRRSVLNKWNSTTLRSITDANTGKSSRDCLQLLIQELRHLQHGLDSNLQTDNFLHNKLILACQELPSC